MLSMELYATKVMPHFPRVVRIRQHSILEFAAKAGY
jgi:hypothetical protein